MSMFEIYVETMPKRAFASALDWPGWSRSGKTEDAALEALVAYGPRYRSAVGRTAVGKSFRPPSTPGDLTINERLPGNATTAFGALGAIPPGDSRPIKAAEVERLTSLLQAAWRAFDRTADRAAASKRALRTGPRGGGRSLDAMKRHILDAEAAYLAKLGAPYRKLTDDTDIDAETADVRIAMLDLIAALARGEPPPRTPRSGSLWPIRFAVRRCAWHALDHTWEIEDRLESPA
jgi:hypothetical protein